MTTHQFYPFNILFPALLFLLGISVVLSSFPCHCTEILIFPWDGISFSELLVATCSFTGWGCWLMASPVLRSVSPGLLCPVVAVGEGLHTHPVLCLFLYPFPTSLPWCPLPPLSDHTPPGTSPALLQQPMHWLWGCPLIWERMRGVTGSLWQCDCLQIPLSSSKPRMNAHVHTGGSDALSASAAPLLCPSSTRAHDNRWNPTRQPFLASQPTLDFKEIFISFTEHYHGITSSAKCLNLNLETSGEARCRPKHSVQSLLHPPVIIGHQQRLPALQRAVS